MPEIKKIWNDFLYSIINETFGEFLDEQEIKTRCEWILSNLLTINPDMLYKNILYMLNSNSLSKIAIGYKLHFIIDNYKELFKAPYTEEFDKNKNLSNSDKSVLDDFILKFSKIINHHIEMLIHDNNYNSNSNIDYVKSEIKNLLEHYKLPNHIPMEDMYIRDDNLIYKMSFGQILYMVSFNQNPFNSNVCSEELSLNIRNYYSDRLMMMDSLKTNFPTGIPLKYVLSKRIF